MVIVLQTLDSIADMTTSLIGYRVWNRLGRGDTHGSKLVARWLILQRLQGTTVVIDAVAAYSVLTEIVICAYLVIFICPNTVTIHSILRLYSVLILVISSHSRDGWFTCSIQYIASLAFSSQTLIALLSQLLLLLNFTASCDAGCIIVLLSQLLLGNSA